MLDTEPLSGVDNAKKYSLKDKILIIVATSIFICIPLFNLISQTKVERYIAYSVSSDINILFTTFENLERNLIEDDGYKKLNLERTKFILSDAVKYIYEVDRSTHKLSILNDNYDLNVLNLWFLLKHMRLKVESGEKLSDEDVNVLKEICSLKETYKDTRSIEIHNYDNNRFTEMKLPKSIEELFYEIDNITSNLLNTK